ncbi:helix-turn-helix domain-containing protein [Nocardia beijingensis]|uniref:PucR family transcriptional regulator n=1 Tax=Nocardia beijingensis TaxID=95162 RepID=UPI00332A33DA
MAARALRSATPGEFPEAEITVRERAGQGIPIEDMLHGYRMSISVIQARFTELAIECGASPDLMLDGVRRLWSMSDAFTARASKVYQKLGIERALGATHDRAAFVRGLLSGHLSPGELTGRGALYGLDPAGRYAAVRARPRDSAMSLEQLRRRLETVAADGRRNAVLAVVDAECVGVVGAPPDVGDAEVVAGIGPMLPLMRARDSFEIAGRVFESALYLGRSGVVAFEDLGWRLAVTSVPDVGRYYRDRLLAPLRTAGEFGPMLEQTLRVYLEQDRNIPRTAAALVVHVNTLRYRLGKIEELTGMSTSSTDGLVGFAWALAADCDIEILGGAGAGYLR